MVVLFFLDNPPSVLREARRVLRADGGLVLGMILAESPWAAHYQEKGRQGHPFYSIARFYSRQELEAWLEQAGFRVVEYRSTLFQAPDAPEIREEEVRPGFYPKAGFTGILARRVEGVG